MEELNKQILPILQEIEKEVVEYFEMTDNIYDYEIRSELKSSVEYGLKRRNLTLEDFNHPYGISEILILVEEIKENNFSYFSNDWNTHGYNHHDHGYRLKELINELRPYLDIVKDLRLKPNENDVGQSDFYKNDEFKIAFEEELKKGDLILLNDEPKEGHTGIIYFGNQRHVGKRAIKVYKTFITDKNKSALLKETELIQRIDHPNIVKAFHHRTFEFRGNQILYLVEEFIDGKTIEDLKNINLLREKSISLKLKLFQDLISAINYIREQLEVHGDIHNENVIITKDNSIKIIDPGFSEYNLDQQYDLDDDDRNSISYIMNSLFTKEEQQKLKLNSIHSLEKVPEILSIVQNIIKVFNYNNDHLNTSEPQLEIEEIPHNTTNTESDYIKQEIKFFLDKIENKNYDLIMDRFNDDRFRIIFNRLFVKIELEPTMTKLYSNSFVIVLGVKEIYTIVPLQKTEENEMEIWKKKSIEEKLKIWLDDFRDRVDLIYKFDI